MNKLNLFLLIILIPFVFSDIAYFESSENYNFYSYDNNIFTNEEIVNTPYIFISTDINYNIINLNNNDGLTYSSTYKYYKETDNFYSLSGSFKINELPNSYPSSYFGYIFFYQPEVDKSIRLVFVDNYFTFTQSAGLKICENSVVNSKNIDIDKWYNYNILIKNDTNQLIFNLKTWEQTEQEPEFYYLNCTISTGSYSQFGTFGIFIKNASVTMNSLNVTGYNIIDTTTEENINYNLDINQFIIPIGLFIIYLIMLLSSFIFEEKILTLTSALFGSFYGLYTISISIPFYIYMPFLAFNLVIIYYVVK